MEIFHQIANARTHIFTHAPHTSVERDEEKAATKHKNKQKVAEPISIDCNSFREAIKIEYIIDDGWPKRATTTNTKPKPKSREKKHQPKMDSIQLHYFYILSTRSNFNACVTRSLIFDIAAGCWLLPNILNKIFILIKPDEKYLFL